MKLKDIDIRKQLHKEINYKFRSQRDTIVIDELNLCQGDARIDIAVINGKIHGYEIKSERDNLSRLSNQIDIYNQVMDTVTIVTGENHLDDIKKIVPTWWGIKTAINEGDKITFHTVKKVKNNPNIDPYSLVQLLWRNETLAILKENGLERGYKSKPKYVLWERLAESLSLEELRSYVRRELKNRKGWRVD